MLLTKNMISIMFYTDYDYYCSNISPIHLAHKSNNMSVLFILIGASIVVALGFLAAFLWSVKSGQYDDDYTPSVRMLFDDEVKNNNTNNNK